MGLTIAWGRQRAEIDLAAEQVIAVRRAAAAPNLADPAAAVRAALEQPLDYPALRRALTPDDHVTIFVDEQLPQLTRLLVPVLEHVRAAGVAAEAITLLCLPPSTGQAWVEELPDEFQDVRVEVHQPDDRRRLSYLATTKRGRRVYLNRSAVDADQLVLLTRRTYDPLLGYGGAEAALYPGLSDEATWQEVGARLEAKAPSHEPWPLRAEAGEIAWLLGAPFLLQVIEGSDDQIAHVVGGPIASGTEGERLLDQRWRVVAERAADVVIASLIGDSQRHDADRLARAACAGARVVRPGGAVVVLTEAAPTLGPSFAAFRRHEEPGPALKELLRDRPDDLPAGFLWASAAARARLYLLSGLPTDLVEEIYATPLEHVSQLRRLLSAETNCLYLPDAHKTLAVVE